MGVCVFVKEIEYGMAEGRESRWWEREWERERERGNGNACKRE